MKRRVVISGPLPPPPGGIASVIRTIVESDLRARWEFAEFDLAARRIPDGLVWRLADAALSRAFGYQGAYGLESGVRIARYAALYRSHVDVAHIHVSHGYDVWMGVRQARVAHRRGAATVLHLHGLYDVEVPRLPRRLQRAFWRCLAVPDRLVVLSEGWRSWFAAGGVPDERLTVLRNPVDVRRFGPRRETRDGVLRLLWVGASDPVRKGGDEILAAAPAILAAVPNARFVCVGADVGRLEETRVRGTPLAPHFAFEGSRNAEQMVPYFETADVLLLPSHSEGLPIALLEAMAASLPVVACPVNGVPEAMDDPANGRFVPPRDPEALARAVIELARDADARRRIGAENRRRVEREFGQSQYAAALEDVYERALRERTR